jgi:4-amino-4-deoxy-L-arabinose transferase-like glycosyltransferase
MMEGDLCGAARPMNPSESPFVAVRGVTIPVVALLVLGGVLWRGAIASLIPLGLDEVYYFTYSDHLNWSYFDHPPLVALTTGLGWWLTGSLAPFTLRWGAVLSYTLSLLLLTATANRLFGARVGWITAAIVTLSPLLWITFGLLTAPDNALMVFWSLVLYVGAVEFLPHHRQATQGLRPWTYVPSWRLALLGLLVGLAGLSKYHGFVLGAGLLGFCLTRTSRWRALRSPWLLLGAVLFTVAIAPILYWNSQHDWISFRFHLGLRFDGGPPTDTTAGNGYSVGQLLGTWLLGVVYLFPSLGFPLWGYTALGLWRQVRGYVAPPLGRLERFRHDREGFILWLSAPIAVGMTLVGGQHHTFPAWPAPGFWGLSIVLAAGMAQWRPKLLRRWLWGTGLVVATLSLVALLHVTLGILQKPSQYSLGPGWVTPEADGSTILLDTLQLRRRIALQPAVLQAIQSGRFVCTDEFYLASYVAMALHPLSDRPVTTFSPDPRGFAFWHDPSDWVGETGVFVTLASFHPETDPAAPVRPWFETVEPLGEVTLTRGGAATETLLFYQVESLQQPYPYPY